MISQAGGKAAMVLIEIIVSRLYMEVFKKTYIRWALQAAWNDPCRISVDRYWSSMAMIMICAAGLSNQQAFGKARRYIMEKIGRRQNEFWRRRLPPRQTRLAESA